MRLIYQFRAALAAVILCLPLGCSTIPPLGGKCGLHENCPPQPVDPAGYHQQSEQQAAEMAQKLAAVQDENKVLHGRLQELQLQLENKDRALGQARTEMQAVTEEMARTRQDLKRWQQELAALRDHARKSDKESQATLQALVTLLESMVEQNNGRPAAPVPLPVKPRETTPALSN